MATDAALDLLSALVLENGARWGEVATDDQRDDARAVLDTSGPPYHFLTRARGYSKTVDLAGVAIVEMVTTLAPGTRLYALAADKDQGRLITDALAGFVARTPGLSNAMTVDTYKATTPGGTVLVVLPADVAGAWGLRPGFLIVDELAQWGTTRGPRKLWEATTSALTKMSGARLVCLTSSGDPAHWSHKILEHAHKDPLWRVHEIAGPPPWADPERLAEQRRRLPESVYARLFENRWTASEDRLTSLDDLRACVTIDGPLEPKAGTKYVIGVDLGIKGDRTVAAVCHGERDGAEVRVVLDRMEVFAGTKSKPVDLTVVEEWLREAARLYHRAELVFDPWQSVGMTQRLRGGGLRVTDFTFSQQSVGRLAVTLHTAIRDHHLALPDDEALIDELANVRLRETSPGVLRMDHDSDKHDDRAIALALAVHHLLDKPRGQGDAFLEVWRREMAGDKDPGAEIARDVRRRTARHDAEERGRRIQRRLCPHFWGPPFDSGERICTRCEMRHSELAESVAT